MGTYEIIILARKHAIATNNDSAMICLADAISLYNKFQWYYARKRALKSLAYSVGMFHDDYKKAAKHID